MWPCQDRNGGDLSPRRRGKRRHIGNIDDIPHNEDWLKVVARDVDAKGKPIPNRFDEEARLRGDKFIPLREREGFDEETAGGDATEE